MKITGDEVIHEVMEMVIIEIIIIEKMIGITETEIIGPPATIEDGTTLAREDLKTDLEIIVEITHAKETPLDNPGPKIEITRQEIETTQEHPKIGAPQGHPETGRPLQETEITHPEIEIALGPLETGITLGHPEIEITQGHLETGTTLGHLEAEITLGPPEKGITQGPPEIEITIGDHLETETKDPCQEDVIDTGIKDPLLEIEEEGIAAEETAGKITNLL